MNRSAGRLVAGSTLALVLLAVSCADETIVGTNQGRQELPPPQYSIEQLGSFAMPVPGTNTVNYAALNWTATGIAVPDSSYVRIRVDGVVTLGTNPEYEQAFPEHPSPGYSGASIPPWGKSYGELRVDVRVSGEAATFHTDMHDGNAMEMLMWVPEGGEVEVSRTGINGMTGGIGHYTLSSTQSIEVTRVEIPARIHVSRTRIEQYDTVRFTGEVDGAAEYTTIFFAAGDTLAEPARDWQGGYNALTVNMRLSQSGRGYLSVEVDHLSVLVPSEVVWVRQPGQTFPSLQLSADRQHVAPGEVVTFTASLSDSTAVTGPHNFQVLNWTWLDSTGTQATVCPEDGYVCAVAVTQAGSMRVQAKVYGSNETASALVAVADSSQWFASDPAAVAVRIHRFVDDTAGAAATWAQISRQMDAAQAIWLGTCNIRIDFLPALDVANPYTDRWGNVENGWTIVVADSAGNFTAAAGKMAGAFPIPDVPVIATYHNFVVRLAQRQDLSGVPQNVNGIAGTGGNYSWLSGINLDAGDKILAHELGHNLGLSGQDGVTVSSNLMTNSPNGKDLSFAQCDTARARATMVEEPS